MFPCVGLPTETSDDIYSSPLIHSDFLDLVESNEPHQTTKKLKASIKSAINKCVFIIFKIIALHEMKLSVR